MAALGAIYGTGEGQGLGVALSGPDGISAPAALGLMSFTLLYTPCLATLGVIRNETRSWKWVGFSVIYGLMVAWVVTLIVFSVGSMVL